MNDLSVICFSSNEEFLNQLLSELKSYFNDSKNRDGFSNEMEFIENLKNSANKNNIKIILIDLLESNSTTLQFLNSVNLLAPNAVKLLISESNNLLKIQTQISNLNSFQFLNRMHNNYDFKIALNSANSYHTNLRILTNQKSKNSNDSKKLDDQNSKQLIEANLEKENEFAIIAHDLKSPFTALLGISEILISDWQELTETEKMELISGLKSSSEKTLVLLETFLKWCESQKKQIH
ncbi:MAG: hypothetical protein GQ525_15965 [Draconibacterium sp.]|nr:hypothetical protein [Draconibacterium sp.]